VKDVPESMKLSGPSNYILWSYKVKMILLQVGLWRFVEPLTMMTRSTNATSSPTTRSKAVEIPTLTTTRTFAPDLQIAPKGDPKLWCSEKNSPK
jgi:hypothetical protein